MHRHQYYTWGNLRQTANVAFIALLRAAQLQATSQVRSGCCSASFVHGRLPPVQCRKALLAGASELASLPTRVPHWLASKRTGPA